MDKELIHIIKRIDLPTLIDLVGPVIKKAIESVNKADDEEALAEVLVTKYGSSLLNNVAIRKAIIDSLDSDQIAQLCKDLNLSDHKSFENYNKALQYFHRYNIKKSQELVRFLGLSSEYLLKEISDDRPTKENISIEYGEEIKALSFLHPYQKQVKDQIMTRFLQKVERKFFVQMPTGAGKTYTALECVVDYLRMPRSINENGLPVPHKFIVWLVDRNELAEQAFQSFKKLWRMRGDREINGFRLFAGFEPEFNSEGGGVVFCGFDKFHAVLKNPEHGSYSSVKFLIENTGVVIVDEAHHSLAETYFATIQKFVNIPFIKLVGLSATPGTTDYTTTQQLVELYSNDKITLRDEDWKEVGDSVHYLQERGYLAQLKTQLLETSFSSHEVDTGRILDELASDSERNERILEQIEIAHNNQESTLVFACTLDHVFALMIMCRYRDIPTKFIVGEVDQSDRIQILESFKKNEFYVLLNLDILSTGIDLPNINKIILARPISSPNLISQIIGRALRGPKNGGNTMNTIINLKDNIINFPGASFLYNYYEEHWEKV